jgi:hypothetical protein
VPGPEGLIASLVRSPEGPLFHFPSWRPLSILAASTFHPVGFADLTPVNIEGKDSARVKAQRLRSTKAQNFAPIS